MLTKTAQTYARLQKKSKGSFENRYFLESLKAQLTCESLTCSRLKLLASTKAAWSGKVLFLFKDLILSPLTKSVLYANIAMVTETGDVFC